MDVTLLSPLGAVVSDLDLAGLEPGEIDRLRQLLADRGVVVFPGQFIDDGAFSAFLGSFGDLMFTTGETAVAGFADLNVISNVGRTTPPRSNFHVDTSYLRTPPAYTALRAVEVPAQGGETIFTNQYRAFETLSSDLHDRLEHRTIRHVVTGLDLGPDDETEAEHPVFRPHPLTGRTALYLTTSARCAAISGLADDDAATIVGQLLEHSTQPENTLRHSWSPGDVVMWDNGCVLHRADHDGVTGDRVMHRGMVASYGEHAIG